MDSGFKIYVLVVFILFSLVPAIWSHISSLFSDSDKSCMVLMDSCFHWLEKHLTNKSFAAEIKNGNVILLHS